MQGKRQQNKRTIFCWGYRNDLEQLYAFYCARYSNISYESFLKLGLSEVLIKMNSIPESEPLYRIIKSRTINLGKIKDKDERNYWREQKSINKIPALYLPIKELDDILKEEMSNGRQGFNKV